ncbi:MAG: PKD domain-containing protein, partial [Ideonella sp.]|nr:PKD domain-containing protein [Ideonella sp.]
SATGDSFERVELYTGGQSITSAYRQPSLDVLSNLRLSFRSPCAGQLQVAGSPPVSLRRFIIDDTRPPGSECRSLGTLADVADLSSLSFDGGSFPGDLIHGVIDTPDDADGYRLYLDGYNKTYTFDLMGAASASGTLANPHLGLYDANLGLIAENDDRDGSTTDARLSITVPHPGVYHLRVTSSRVAPGTGSFLLKVSGIDPSMRDAPLLPVASLQGAYTGRLRGPAPAHVSLSMAADGTVGGVLTVLHPSRQRVTLRGTMAPDGVLSFGGEGLASGPIRCQAAAINGGIFGGCGQAGMLSGRSITRSADAYGPIELPPSAVVGQPVSLSTPDASGPYPVTYSWDFGDGSAGAGATPPPHVYARPGLHTVNVTITGGSTPSAQQFGRASLMVFCADGTLCTDLDEPLPWVAIDSASCALRSVPPDRPRNYTAGPVITFTGRASGSSGQQLVSFASGNRRLTEAQVRQSLYAFAYWDQQQMSLACDGRDPCSVGPFGSFTDSPAYRTGPYLELQFLWEQRPLTDPQPVWLYVALVDQAYSQVLSVAEQPLTCPGHLGFR